MFELLNETLFEKHIAEYLAGSKMYNQRTPKDFNIQKLVDSDMLLQFLREFLFREAEMQISTTAVLGDTPIFTI